MSDSTKPPVGDPMCVLAQGHGGLRNDGADPIGWPGFVHLPALGE